MEVISVIVPVFNVEDFLNRCIRSMCSRSIRLLKLF